jgi:uncharacterized membrane protein
MKRQTVGNGRSAARSPRTLRKQHGQAVHQQSAVLKLMPLDDFTKVTDDERCLIRRWFESGAPVN